MNAQRTKRIPGPVDGRNGVIHAQVPESDFAIAAARDQLAETASLHVDVCNPLLVFAPYLDHGRGGF